MTAQANVNGQKKVFDEKSKEWVTDEENGKGVTKEKATKRKLKVEFVKEVNNGNEILPSKEKRIERPLVRKILTTVVDRIIDGVVKGDLLSAEDHWWNKGIRLSFHAVQTQINMVQQMGKGKLSKSYFSIVSTLLQTATQDIQSKMYPDPKTSGEQKLNYALVRSIEIINTVILEEKGK
ncbi:MAG: hypothetical protein HQ543_03125 [Bacteroidetes bacterium]|nr:hypothetical protein [Bacteroidota bacterium]